MNKDEKNKLIIITYYKYYKTDQKSLETNFDSPICIDEHNNRVNITIHSEGVSMLKEPYQFIINSKKKTFENFLKDVYRKDIPRRDLLVFRDVLLEENNLTDDLKLYLELI